MFSTPLSKSLISDLSHCDLWDLERFYQEIDFLCSDLGSSWEDPLSLYLEPIL